MLRITVQDKPAALEFHLEGRLAGPWVEVLEECWQGEVPRRRERILRVDLNGVTSMDAIGQAKLVEMHRRGAELVAGDCLMQSIVAELIGEEQGTDQLPARGPPDDAPHASGTHVNDQSFTRKGERSHERHPILDRPD